MPELDIISLRLPLIVFGLLIIGCVVSSKISSRFSMPGLLVFLLIGMGMHLLLAGTGNADAAGALLSPQIANAIGTVALGIILFSGGMDSSFDDIKRVFKTGTILSTAGVLLTALLVGSFAYLIALGYDRGDLWPQCFLFGSIISSTDASAVFSILRSKRISLKGNLKPLLEYESGSNDPMATFLTLFFLHICLLHSNGESVGVGNLLMMIPEFFYKMGLGVAIGVLVGITVVWLFNHIRLDYDGLYYVLGLSAIALSYSLADLCWGSNGFMATYTCGVCMGARKFVFRNTFLRFADALGWLSQVVLFTMLGFMATPALIVRHWWLGLVMAIALMLVARPIATFICMFKSRFSFKAKVLVSWVGLRGGAPIMLATFPLLLKGDASPTGGVDGDWSIYDMIFNMVFYLVLLSVVLQSFTIMPLAKLLGLDAPLKMTPPAPISFDQITYLDNRKLQKSENAPDDLAYNEPATYVIAEDSDIKDIQIKDLKLPEGVFIVMISRKGRWLVPRGGTILKADDSLTVLATPLNHKAAAEFFAKKSHNNL